MLNFENARKLVDVMEKELKDYAEGFLQVIIDNLSFDDNITEDASLFWYLEGAISDKDGLFRKNLSKFHTSFSENHRIPAEDIFYSIINNEDEFPLDINVYLYPSGKLIFNFDPNEIPECRDDFVEICKTYLRNNHFEEDSYKNLFINIKKL